MNIKENIGARITKVRKELGITIKELAARTGTLSPARISNWEQGTRSPGPMEAKQLANVLNISASYLLCLTDHPQGEISIQPGNINRFIPVLFMKDVIEKHELKEMSIENSTSFDGEKKSVLIDAFNPTPANAFLFAVLMNDNSMQPDFSQGDLVIINRDRKACPGDLVLTYLSEKKQTVVRKYGETESCLFQLLASNPLWATINIKDKEEAVIVGVVTEYRRYL